MEGTLIEVSPDAQVNNDSASFYKVTIVPSKTQISTKDGNVPLRPGLLVTAEIVTEQRTVLSFLFEPIRKFKND